MSIKIGLLSAHHNNGCGFYRGIGPWSGLSKRFRNVVTLQILQTKPHWSEVRACDAIFLQRPFDRNDKDSITFAKDYGVPVWVDFDDDVFSVPTDNPTHGIYAQATNIIDTEWCLQQADVVSVSTKALKQAYAKYNKNVVVVPNSLDQDVMRLYQGGDRQKCVLWRGTRTHDRDVGSVANEIVETSKRFEDMTFAFLGEADPCPWLVTERIKRVARFHGSKSAIIFFQTMVALRPLIVIAPLQDCQFNRCKSNIAAIEAALAGAVCLGPEWEEWMIPGVSNYLTPQSFKDQLCALLSNPQDCVNRAHQTWEYVKDNLTSVQTDRLRMVILEELL